MVAPRTHRVAQSRKPRSFHQSGVNGKLRPRHSPGIDRVHVVGIRFQLLLFQALCPLFECFDLFLDLWIGGPMRVADKAIVRVFAGIHRAHSIKLADQDSRHQVVDGKRVVRMPAHDLVKILDRPVVVEIVVMIESLRTQRIAGPVGSVRRPHAQSTRGSRSHRQKNRRRRETQQEGRAGS